MFKNFVIALTLGLLQIQESFGTQVTISTVAGEEIETGIYTKIDEKTWNVQFPCPAKESLAQHLANLKNKFQTGKTIRSSNGLYGTVNGSEIESGTNNVIVTFTDNTYQASLVQKNLTTQTFEVEHISVNDDTGILFSNNTNLYDTFKIDDLIQYGRKGTTPEELSKRTVRLVTDREKGSMGCVWVFGKSLVNILKDGKLLVANGRLFAADSDQKNITVEVKYTDEITESFVTKNIEKTQTLVIQPITKGLNAEGSYKVKDMSQSVPDLQSNKQSKLIYLQKQ